MTFPAYPAYKDSGVEWLGAVPDDWVVRKVSVDFSATKGPRGALLTKEYCHENSGEYPVYSGQTENGGVLGEIADFDFDLGRDGAILSTTVGAKAMSVSHITGRVSLSQNCMIIKSIGRDISTKFFFYHFQPLFLLERRMIPDHMQPSFRMEDLYSFRIAVPPDKEQTQIARFLDHETARIDALIEEQQRLIELLKEKRQAVISHAVTKGLDPTVPMKDSGVEWLGEVPAHWVVGPLRWYATIQGGIAKGKDYEGRQTVSLPYLRVANVQNGFVDLTEVKEISVLESEVERYSLRLGDVLMNEGGDNDKLGRGTVWQGQIEPCLHQNHVFAIRPNDLLSAEWLATFTQCDQARSYFFLNSKQSTNLASISASNVMSLALPIPSVAEQKEILSTLNQSRVAHEELVNLAASTVEFLKERRSALISAAVTGKIDVRGWQSPVSSPSPELVQEAV